MATAVKSDSVVLVTAGATGIGRGIAGQGNTSQVKITALRGMIVVNDKSVAPGRSVVVQVAKTTKLTPQKEERRL